MKRTAKKSSAKKSSKAAPSKKVSPAKTPAPKAPKGKTPALVAAPVKAGNGRGKMDAKDAALHAEMLAKWTAGTPWKDIIAATGWKSGRSHLVTAAGGLEGFTKAQAARNANLVKQGRHPFVKGKATRKAA